MDPHVAHGSHPSPFRPGSGALGSIRARAAALPQPPVTLTPPTAPETPLSELLSVKTGGKTTAAGAGPRPLLNLQTATTVAVATLTMAGVSMFLCGAPGGPYRDGRRPLLGFGNTQPDHISKVPPYWDPTCDHEYSFRTYMNDMSNWVLLTDLPPHQQAVMVARHLGGAARGAASLLWPGWWMFLSMATLLRTSRRGLCEGLPTGSGMAHRSDSSAAAAADPWRGYVLGGWGSPTP